MKPPRHLNITTTGRDEHGNITLNVQLRRRTVAAWRLFYRAARAHGAGRLHAARVAGRICRSSDELGTARVWWRA